MALLRLFAFITTSILLGACSHAYRIEAPTTTKEFAAPANSSRETVVPLINGICLSGGGYRAMLFHAGVLWRLNDAGLLRHVRVISSVSGGSITAAALAKNWESLHFDEWDVAQNFDTTVVQPLRSLAGKTIDTPSVIFGLITPRSAANYLVDAYKQSLYGDATLGDAYAQSGPQPLFIFHATSLASGNDWFFAIPDMIGDKSTGVLDGSRIPLAVVVAASSAFPPYLAPVELDLSKLPRLQGRQSGPPPAMIKAGNEQKWRDFVAYLEKSQKENFQASSGRIPLVDGGVQNNLGSDSCISIDEPWARSRGFVVDSRLDLPFATKVPSNWFAVTERVTDVIYDRAETLLKENLGYLTKEGGFLRYSLKDTQYSEQQILDTPVFVSLQNADLLKESRLYNADAIESFNRVRDAISASVEKQHRPLPWPHSERDSRFDVLYDNPPRMIEIATVPTRLKALDDCVGKHLVNWGYTLADGALVKYWAKQISIALHAQEDMDANTTNNAMKPTDIVVSLRPFQYWLFVKGKLPYSPCQKGVG